MAEIFPKVHMRVMKRCTVCHCDEHLFFFDRLGTIQLTYLSIIEKLWCINCNAPASYLRLVFEAYFPGLPFAKDDTIIESKGVTDA